MRTTWVPIEEVIIADGFNTHLLEYCPKRKAVKIGVTHQSGEYVWFERSPGVKAVRLTKRPVTL